MARMKHVTDDQLERLRQRQADDLAALVERNVAAARLDATTRHRAEVIEKENAAVRDATDALARATRALVERVGVDSAAMLSGTPPEAVRALTRQPRATSSARPARTANPRRRGRPPRAISSAPTPTATATATATAETSAPGASLQATNGHGDLEHVDKDMDMDMGATR